MAPENTSLNRTFRKIEFGYKELSPYLPYYITIPYVSL